MLQNHQELVKRYLEGEEAFWDSLWARLCRPQGQAEPRLVNKLLVKA